MIPAPQRRRLVHVVPNLWVNSITTHIWDMLAYLREYHHTVLFEGNLFDSDARLMWALAETGADVVHVTSSADSHEVGLPAHGTVMAAMLQEVHYDAAILHSLVGHEGLGKAIPSIYYSYGVYDPAPQADAVVCCSQYAKVTGRTGAYKHAPPQDAPVIHPGVPARMLRRRRQESERFAVGLVNSGSFGKYPLKLARRLLTKLPIDAVLYLSAPNKHIAELRQIALSANRRINLVNVQAMPGRQLVSKLDVLVQGYADDYYSPYSKTVIEAMCAGVPVVCQKRGFLSEQLTDEQNCLFFDQPEEALEQVLLLQQNEEAATAMGLNGKAWAFTQDQSVYMNQFRSLLRQLGA